MLQFPRKRVLTGITFINGWYPGRMSMKDGHTLVPLIPSSLSLRFEFLWNRVVCAYKGHDRILEPVIEVHEDGKFPCCMCGALVPVEK